MCIIILYKDIMVQHRNRKFNHDTNVTYWTKMSTVYVKILYKIISMLLNLD